MYSNAGPRGRRRRRGGGMRPTARGGSALPARRPTAARAARGGRHAGSAGRAPLGKGRGFGCTRGGCLAPARRRLARRRRRHRSNSLGRPRSAGAQVHRGAGRGWRPPPRDAGQAPLGDRRGSGCTRGGCLAARQRLARRGHRLASCAHRPATAGAAPTHGEGPKRLIGPAPGAAPPGPAGGDRARGRPALPHLPAPTGAGGVRTERALPGQSEPAAGPHAPHGGQRWLAQ